MSSNTCNESANGIIKGFQHSLTQSFSKGTLVISTNGTFPSGLMNIWSDNNTVLKYCGGTG